MEGTDKDNDQTGINVSIDGDWHEGGGYAPCTHRVHSIHRNKLYTGSNNNHLLHLYQARTGGVDGSTSARTRSGSNFMETHANLIVAKMEQDPELIEDSPRAEEMRREALRDMPQSLTLKKFVKEKLTKTVSRRSKKKPISRFRRFKYRNSMLISKFKSNLKNLAYTCELWYDALKHIEGNFGSGIGAFFKFLRWIFILNLMISAVSFTFIVLPQITWPDKTNNSILPTEDFHWYDIFTGEGYLTGTALCYGSYANSSIHVSFLKYSMPDAYFFTMLLIYLCCLAVFSYSLASSYRHTFIETEGGLKNVYAHKIFCGWDYSIATKDAAVLKHHAIYNQLKELLYDSTHQKRESTCIEKFLSKGMQFSMNVFIIMVLIGIGYLLWFLINKSVIEQQSPVLTAVTVNIIMTFAPILFSVVVKFEGYEKPKTMLALTLVRVFVLGFIIIGVLIVFWLNNPNHECWETSLGQEIYRLILFDFLFSVIVSPLIDLIVYTVYRHQNAYPHFDISRHTTQIIYNQTLFWVGFFFAPLLAVIVTIKIFLLWYTRQFVLKLCRPSSDTWRATQTQTWFLMLAFLGLLLVGGLLGYIISYIPTGDCGPFSNYEYIYELLVDGTLKLKKNSFVFNIMLFITKPSLVTLFLIGLCARVYYLRGKALGQRELVASYRNMLMWESRDKEFLLKSISRLTKGKWHYNLDAHHLDPVMSSPGAFKFSNYEEVSDDKASCDEANCDFSQYIPSTSSSDVTNATMELKHLYPENKKKY